MSRRQENEITFYTVDNIKLCKLIDGFLESYAESFPENYKYESRLFMLFEGSQHTKNKLTIKLQKGNLNYRFSFKDFLAESGNIQKYLEKHMKWIGIDKINENFFKKPIYSCYYKDKYIKQFKYNGVKYKISGDRVIFIDLENCKVKNVVYYIEIESKEDFSVDLQHISFSYFVENKKMNIIDEKHTKYKIGSSYYKNGLSNIWSNCEVFENIVFDIYKQIFKYLINNP